MTPTRIDPPAPATQSPYRHNHEERREEREAEVHPTFAAILRECRAAGAKGKEGANR